MNYQEYLETALTITDISAKIFKEGFVEISNNKNVEWKSESDPVTEFDKKIEKITREYILSKYPDHLVLGEEDGLNSTIASDFKWIIDPIDGTINYIRGIAFVAYSLALSYKDEIVVAVVCNPILDECFHAVKGQGAFLNGKKITVSTCQELKQSYLTLGTYKEEYKEQFHSLVKMFQSVRNPGSAALALAYVAMGRMEAAMYFRLSPWDIAGGYLLVKEAGGIMTNINSDSFSLEKPSILASNPFCYNHIATVLSPLTQFS